MRDNYSTSICFKCTMYKVLRIKAECVSVPDLKEVLSSELAKYIITIV